VAAPVLEIRIDAGGGDDSFNLSALPSPNPADESRDLPATMNGGVGSDTFTGSANADVFDGGSGNDAMRGLSGPDRFAGGDGNDTLDLSVGGPWIVALDRQGAAHDGAQGQGSEAVLALPPAGRCEAPSVLAGRRRARQRLVEAGQLGPGGQVVHVRERLHRLTVLPHHDMRLAADDRLLGVPPADLPRELHRPVPVHAPVAPDRVPLLRDRPDAPRGGGARGNGDPADRLVADGRPGDRRDGSPGAHPSIEARRRPEQGYTAASRGCSSVG
jgi:Ca2+-binding RTX toxin-like protein